MSRLDRQTLSEKRDELLSRLERIHADLKSGLGSDLDEQLENRDTLLEIARATEEELEKVLGDLRDAGD